MDGIQILVNLASNINGAFVSLAITLGGFFAVFGAIGYLAHTASSEKKNHGRSSGPGKAIAWLLLCGALGGLDQMVSAGAQQLGWQGATFGAISYIDVGTFGVAADAGNAILTLIRTLGWFYALQGILNWRRSLKEGHTGLSSSQDVSTGSLKFVIGVMMICCPNLLDALQKTLGLL
ncbi:conjugal transfer protein TraQ [Morganella morganii]